MKQYLIKYIFVISACVIPFLAHSQVDTLNVLSGETEVKKEKPDTLRYFILGDWHKNTVSFAWNVNPYFNTIGRVSINDTLPNDVRTEYPYFKQDVGATFTVASGGAAMPHDFFKRNVNQDYRFFEPYDVYMFTPDNIPFYNTKRPFTVLSYQLSGSRLTEESNIRVVHTQNITPEWNAGILYQRYGTRGQYQNEETDNKAFAIFTDYAGERYMAHAAYMFNNISNEENGGIQRDTDVTDTIIDSEEMDVNLMKARNKLKKHTFFFSHSLGIPLYIFKKKDTTHNDFSKETLIYFGNSLEYTTYQRRYTDTYNNGETYYDNWYYNASESRDSSRTTIFDGKLFMRLQPWAADAIISNISGGVGYQNQKYYYFDPSQYIEGTKSESESYLYLYGNASGKFNKYFEWDAFTRYYITGKTDFLIDGNARLSLFPIKEGIHLKGRFLFHYYEPNYFTQNYYSNHVKWTNDFEKTTRSQFEVSLDIPQWDLEVGVKQALIKNYIYNDIDALPKQYSDNLNVTSIYAKKNFKFGIVRLDNEVLVQLSGNDDVLPLPKLSARATWYIQASLVKGVLTGQFGFDTRYNSSYYIPAYNPAAGDFHVQNEKKVGGFPYVEAFANFKWKRTTIFAKYTNILKDSFGSEYFSALHYPRNNAMLFRLGITWHFFN